MPGASSSPATTWLEPSRSGFPRPRERLDSQDGRGSRRRGGFSAIDPAAISWTFPADERLLFSRPLTPLLSRGQRCLSRGLGVRRGRCHPPWQDDLDLPHHRPPRPHRADRELRRSWRPRRLRPLRDPDPPLEEGVSRFAAGRHWRCLSRHAGKLADRGQDHDRAVQPSRLRRVGSWQPRLRLGPRGLGSRACHLEMRRAHRKPQGGRQAPRRGGWGLGKGAALGDPRGRWLPDRSDRPDHARTAPLAHTRDPRRRRGFRSDRVAAHQHDRDRGGEAGRHRGARPHGLALSGRLRQSSKRDLAGRGRSRRLPCRS